MKVLYRKDPEDENISEVKIFPIPSASIEIKDNITIRTKTPSNPSKEQIINKAFKFHSQGNILEALKHYRYFINRKFKDQRVFCNYGVILKDLGKLKDAEVFTRKAIELNPDYTDAHYNLGIILKDLGKLQEAELAYRKAIELKPDFALAHSNLGNILSDLGKLKDAEVFTCKAIELNPDFAEAHSNLGNILRDLGKLQEAEISTRKAIELNPDFAEVHSNLGSILRDLGKLQEAEVSTRKAIELNPHFAEAQSNLGGILSDLGKLQEAEVFTRKAIALNPDYAEASWNLSLLQLLQGDYKNGLENYEFRSKIKKPITPHGKPKIKQVDNQNIEKEEKLLVISEQGLGDTLQYMRYIPYLRSQGLDVSFCALTKLHSLIQSSGIDHNPLTPQQSTLVSEGQWIPLLSLPRYLQITPEKPIITEPYIYSTEELNQKWKKILSSEKKPIIGINWQGNPELERSFYQGRSIPLESFSKLFDHNEITLLSLQKGFGSEQLNHCSFKNKFIDCQPQIDSTWDFLENAAIIENCDLIITCDTSIAHLAGGMGKEVWLLLRDIPYWTWGVKGNHTFWYPSMKLFRQKERHNWQEVMERVSNQINIKYKNNIFN
ncbi:tetratricopeptide repeat protein [Prochlorococcus sp. MIT 0916]|uniref:tetratricopeptide repeat protein n=1 Tax=Prochlorococcus sp. MIT 0916 TaxID=3082521 RepID=UPI0039B51A71